MRPAPSRSRPARGGLAAAIAASLLGIVAPSTSRAGPGFGLEMGPGAEYDFRGGEVRALAPAWLSASYLVRDEGPELEAGFELGFGPILNRDSPRYAVSFVLNTEKAYRELYPHEYLLLHSGGMYETSYPNRWGLTAGFPYRIWTSETFSWRVTVAFTWLFENSRSPATGMLYVTFGPWFIPEGRTAAGARRE